MLGNLEKKPNVFVSILFTEKSQQSIQNIKVERRNCSR